MSQRDIIARKMGVSFRSAVRGCGRLLPARVRAGLGVDVGSTASASASARRRLPRSDRPARASSTGSGLLDRLVDLRLDRLVDASARRATSSASLGRSSAVASATSTASDPTWTPRRCPAAASATGSWIATSSVGSSTTGTGSVTSSATGSVLATAGSAAAGRRRGPGGRRRRRCCAPASPARAVAGSPARPAQRGEWPPGRGSGGGRSRRLR